MGLLDSLFGEDDKQKKNKKNKNEEFLKGIIDKDYLWENNGNVYMALDDMDEDEDEDYD